MSQIKICSCMPVSHWQADDSSGSRSFINPCTAPCKIIQYDSYGSAIIESGYIQVVYKPVIIQGFVICRIKNITGSFLHADFNSFICMTFYIINCIISHSGHIIYITGSQGNKPHLVTISSSEADFRKLVNFLYQWITNF